MYNDTMRRMEIKVIQVMNEIHPKLYTASSIGTSILSKCIKTYSNSNEILRQENDDANMKTNGENKRNDICGQKLIECGQISGESIESIFGIS